MDRYTLIVGTDQALVMHLCGPDAYFGEESVRCVVEIDTPGGMEWHCFRVGDDWIVGLPAGYYELRVQFGDRDVSRSMDFCLELRAL
jgi:hypothetical protein